MGSLSSSCCSPTMDDDDDDDNDSIDSLDVARTRFAKVERTLTNPEDGDTIEEGNHHVHRTITFMMPLIP